MLEICYGQNYLRPKKWSVVVEDPYTILLPWQVVDPFRSVVAMPAMIATSMEE